MDKTTKNNVLIAEFMIQNNKLILHHHPELPLGMMIEFRDDSDIPSILDDESHYFLYHKSWEWIMPVVQKIQSIEPYQGLDSYLKMLHNCFVSANIDDVNEIVLFFIEHYNRREKFIKSYNGQN